MTNHRWRVGRKLGRTLYRDEVCVGMVDTPEIAAEIVRRMNAIDMMFGTEPKPKCTCHAHDGWPQLHEICPVHGRKETP